MKKLLLLSTLFILFAVQTSWAQSSKTIEGLAIDSMGAPLPDGDKNVTFIIYETIDGDTPLWSEQQYVPIKDGRFAASLGQVNDLDLPENKSYWLTMKVGEGKELSPRLELNLGENDETMRKSALVANNLDEAYDGGGAGLGRTITADAGAVNIAGTDGLTVTGKVGIGTTSPGAALHLSQSSGTDTWLDITGNSSAQNSIRIQPQNTNTSAGARGLQVVPVMKAQVGGSAGYGVQIDTQPQANLTGFSYGTLAIAQLSNSTFNVPNYFPMFFRFDTQASYSGALTNVDVFRIQSPVLNGSTPSNIAGLNILNQGAASITNAYGLRIFGQSGATNNWNIYSEGASSTNFFEGNVGIGTDTPGTNLEVAGQVKITGGTPGAGKVLTSDVNGLASWQTPAGGGGGGNSITDNDNDTKVQTEESADEDKIRFDTASAQRMIIDELGNVGIGTASPNEQLEMTGNLRLPPTTATTGIIRSGANTLIHSFGANNYFAGENAGNLTLTGTANTAVGKDAFAANTTAHLNTAIGFAALGANTTGGNNTAVGANALDANTTAINNTALGHNSLGANTTGANNTAVGTFALEFNTTGAANTAVGKSALLSNTLGGSNTAVGNAALLNNSTAGANTAVGNSALSSNTTGGFNTAVGNSALSSNTTAISNTAVGASALRDNTAGNNSAVGYFALLKNTTGSGNTAFGTDALRENTTSGSNTAVGRSALRENTTGASNTAIGLNALDSNTTGSRNTAIGYNADVSADNLINATAIGANAVVGASHSLVLGGTGANAVAVGIGITTPTAQLHTTGGVRFANFGAGTLQTDASGNVSVSSDIRLKNVQGDFERGLSQILTLKPINYTWKEETGFDTENTYAGFSAQNVRDVIPEAVSTDQNDHLTLSDRPIIAALVNAVKELSVENEQLKTKIFKLESMKTKIARLELTLQKLALGTKDENDSDDTVSSGADASDIY